VRRKKKRGKTLREERAIICFFFFFYWFFGGLALGCTKGEAKDRFFFFFGWHVDYVFLPLNLADHFTKNGYLAQ
jgi:hypothetical protein